MTYVAFSIGYTKYVTISNFKYRRLFKYIHIFLFAWEQSDIGITSGFFRLFRDWFYHRPGFAETG